MLPPGRLGPQLADSLRRGDCIDWHVRSINGLLMISVLLRCDGMGEARRASLYCLYRRIQKQTRKFKDVYRMGKTLGTGGEAVLMSQRHFRIGAESALTNNYLSTRIRRGAEWHRQRNRKGVGG